MSDKITIEKMPMRREVAMQEIKCPKCGEVFQVDESGYAAIVKQVRDEEFKKELEQREMAFSSEKRMAVELAVKDTIAAMTRQELVNMMRSTMNTALQDFHNTTVMMDRMEKGTKKWQD